MRKKRILKQNTALEPWFERGNLALEGEERQPGMAAWKERRGGRRGKNARSLSGAKNRQDKVPKKKIIQLGSGGGGGGRVGATMEEKKTFPRKSDELRR